MPYKTGNLIHRVVVEKINRNFRSEAGDVLERWEYFDERWASIKSIRAMEKIRNAEAVEDITHTVVMRWFPDFNSTDYRLVFEGRVLDLVSVTDPDEDGTWWEITANEQRAGGTHG